MLFTQGIFFGFFLLVFCVHWGLRSFRARKLWLLAASYTFYAGWDWRFLSLILFSTCVDFLVGRKLSVTEDKRRRLRWLRVSLAANLGLLGFFKYFNFFIEGATDLLGLVGFEAHAPTLNIVLPVGISFYTFQTMSYTIDVYYRRLEPVKSFWDFALFVAFFPQLVAGPIVRAVTFVPQLFEDRVFSKHVALRANLSLFLWGFIKKACIADHVSQVVDELFADPAAFSTTGTWLSIALYHVQVYCDFSGYSDMAIATAGLLGYQLTENFRFPYFAGSIGEFWRRWHISLSAWLKDYVYIPLGGGRVPTLKRIRNVFVVIVSCGVWHGAGWKYIAFGLLHSVFVAICQIWKYHPARNSRPGRVVVALGLPVSTFCLFLGWPMFRSESFEGTLQIYRTFLGIDPGGVRGVDPWWGWFFVALVVAHWVSYRRLLNDRLNALPHWVFAMLYGAAWALVLPWVATGYTPFIYFQF